MIDAGIVRGSKEMAVPLYIGKTTVYVHEDIHEVEVEMDGETYTEYEYHEYQYPKDEYIEIMSKQNDKNTSDIDFIAMETGVELEQED